jgi:hypothetical protein
MKAGERTSPRSYDTASTICRSTDFPAQSPGHGSPKARLRATAKRLAALLVDLLLDILLCLLRIRDDAPDDPEASADSPIYGANVKTVVAKWFEQQSSLKRTSLHPASPNAAESNSFRETH